MCFMIENFKKFGSKTALVFNDKSYSYDELYGLIKKIEDDGVFGIKKGEVVAVLSDYSLYSIALFFALLKNKNIIVPITPTTQNDDMIKEAYVQKMVNITAKDISVFSYEPSGTNDKIKFLQDSQKAGLILFSSGSTGKPKAMIHDLDSLVLQYYGKKEKSINIMILLMFDHIGGLNTLLNTLCIGACAVIPQSKNADNVCFLIQKYKISILPSSPSFLNLILMSKAYKKYDLSSLRLITYGTESMPESLLLRLRAVFTRVKFLQTFGTSETGIANTVSKSSDSTIMKIDDGNVKYKVVNGELWLKSKTQILGYLNASMENFSDDGWFKTGDLVEILEDGYIKIIGRNKEVINVAGQKVLPAEVESVILQIDDIRDCVVYGQKNAITGESVVCDMVLENLNTSINAKALIRSYCKDKLEGYKIPVKVNVVDKIDISSRFKKSRKILS